MGLIGGVGVVLVFGLAIEGFEKFEQAKSALGRGLSVLLVALSGSSKSSSKKAAAFVRRAT